MVRGEKNESLFNGSYLWNEWKAWEGAQLPSTYPRNEASLDSLPDKQPGIGRYTRRVSHFPTGYGGIEEYLRAHGVYSVAFGATAFSIWVDARQHPHYRAAFRAAATCVTRAP
jgi:hypothetical protein